MFRLSMLSRCGLRFQVPRVVIESAAALAGSQWRRCQGHQGMLNGSVPVCVCVCMCVRAYAFTCMRAVVLVCVHIRIYTTYTYCNVFCHHANVCVYTYIYIDSNPPGPTSAMKLITSVPVLARTDIENPVNINRFCVRSYGLKLI